MYPVRCNVSLRNKSPRKPSSSLEGAVNTPESGIIAGANDVDEVDFGLGRLTLSRDEDELVRKQRMDIRNQDVGASELGSYPRLGIEIERVENHTPSKLKKIPAPLALESTEPTVPALGQNATDTQREEGEFDIKVGELQKEDSEDAELLWKAKDEELKKVIDKIVTGDNSNDQNIEFWEAFGGKWRHFFKTIWLNRT